MLETLIGAKTIVGMNIESLEEKNEEFFVEEKKVEYQRRPPCIDIALFKDAVQEFFSGADKKVKKELIDKIWACCDWYVHHIDKGTGRGVYAEAPDSIEYKHELQTAICLTQQGYDVLFAPSGMFQVSEKKFDVFLIKGTIMLKADLKAITSKHPDTIAYRIRYGSTQASRVILHVVSDISPKVLIDALRSGCYNNSNLVEIFLLYKKCFYKLPKNLITSKRILEVIK
jgi:hypothetical protein